MVRAQCLRVEVVNQGFIKCLKPALNSLKLHGHPGRIFNVDEVGFPLSGRANCVLSKKGMKSLHSLIPGSGRDSIAVQVCCSASGELFSPYVIYTGQRLQYNCTSGGPLHTKNLHSRQNCDDQTTQQQNKPRYTFVSNIQKR